MQTDIESALIELDRQTFGGQLRSSVRRSPRLQCLRFGGCNCEIGILELRLGAAFRRLLFLTINRKCGRTYPSSVKTLDKENAGLQSRAAVSQAVLGQHLAKTNQFTWPSRLLHMVLLNRKCWAVGLRI